MLMGHNTFSIKKIYFGGFFLEYTRKSLPGHESKELFLIKKIFRNLGLLPDVTLRFSDNINNLSKTHSRQTPDIYVYRFILNEALNNHYSTPRLLEGDALRFQLIQNEYMNGIVSLLPSPY